MMGQPLAWTEAAGLPEEAFEVSFQKPFQFLFGYFE